MTKRAGGLKVHPPGENVAARAAPTAVRENFPVASLLIGAELRPLVRTFYAFARAADDVADCPTLAPQDKLARLARFAAGLDGSADGAPEALALRRALAERNALAALSHANRLLAAFRSDAVQRERADWADLMGYCALSANPVGRFLLDLHGEQPEAWASSDALCTALQVLNHVQDIGRDHALLGRIYLPGDLLRAAGVRPRDLSAAALTPALRAVADLVLDECDRLVSKARALPDALRSRRLAGEAAVIVDLAARLSTRLRRGDMLSRRIAPSALDRARAAASGTWRVLRPRGAILGLQRR